MSFAADVSEITVALSVFAVVVLAGVTLAEPWSGSTAWSTQGQPLSSLHGWPKSRLLAPNLQSEACSLQIFLCFLRE